MGGPQIMHREFTFLYDLPQRLKTIWMTVSEEEEDFLEITKQKLREHYSSLRENSIDKKKLEELKEEFPEKEEREIISMVLDFHLGIDDYFTLLLGYFSGIIEKSILKDLICQPEGRKRAENLGYNIPDWLFNLVMNNDLSYHYYVFSHFFLKEWIETGFFEGFEGISQLKDIIMSISESFDTRKRISVVLSIEVILGIH